MEQPIPCPFQVTLQSSFSSWEMVPRVMENILSWEKTHQAEPQALAELQNHSLSHQLGACTFQIQLVLEHRILEGAGTPSPSCGDDFSSVHVDLQKGLNLADALCLLGSA